jgi:hypothetical protein
MPYYRVMLHGTGIRVPSQEVGREIIGFYTTRLVLAPTEGEAVTRAHGKVMSQWSSGNYARSNKGQLPELSTQWVERTSFLDLFFFKATGHTFYAADDDAA